MNSKAVFSSDITRGNKPLQNDLYDLVKVIPAKPTTLKCEMEYPCDFHPNTDKVYVPKKRVKFCKVRTVRNIRQLFEADVLPDLSKDLDKQQQILLKKITSGSSREQTKDYAKNLLKCDKPVSRCAWQMLMTLNPEAHAHAIQYVLWNGRRIRVNGSKGGKNNFLCNYDLAMRTVPKKERRNNIVTEKKSLLQKSLSIKFKPGPLSKKHILDGSYQKYNVGNIEVVNLPNPSLDIRTTYGVALEPTITNFLQSLRDPNGIISEKWANFAVSAFGTVKDNVPIQNSKEPGITFKLHYKYNQKRMLMRRDYNSEFQTVESVDNAHSQTSEMDEYKIKSEVKSIIEHMLDSVEISLHQNDMFIEEDELRVNSVNDDKHVSTTDVPKEKYKRRYCELDRLDVTIIRLPQAPRCEINNTCTNAHCSLGCVCASLQCEYHLKQHCGRLECMFECKCEFTQYKGDDSFNNECPGLIPGLINLDNELSLRLAKEEQKFHQTVVMTGEKSILLKQKRRNWKTSKRYSDFYSNMCLKDNMKSQRTLTVVDVKLNCKNIEPWCMVHNLYKCFCKGKFTHSVNTDSLMESEMNENISHEENESSTPYNSDNNSNRPNACFEFMKRQSISENSQTLDDSIDFTSVYSKCARTKPYRGRKYKEAYYKNTNRKILEMEKNDDHLRNKMASIINKIDSDNSNCDVLDSSPIQYENDRVLRKKTRINTIYSDNSNDSTSIQKDDYLLSINDTSNSSNVLLEHEAVEDNSSNSSSKMRNMNNKMLSSQIFSTKASNSSSTNDTISNKNILGKGSNKQKLITWLETSYKQYKKREPDDKGQVKKSLDPPKHGKVALYPWEFILSRYRERKNLFLVSQQKPYRIFMAIDIRHSFFENFINIDDIRFADLNKYPNTVKNLLTNATDLKDNFCILCGLMHCWELIGSVTKVNDKFTEKNKDSENDQNTESEKVGETSRDTEISTDITSDNKQVEVQVIPEQNLETEANLNADSSKWFVMTVENDFTEIQFHNRGFFVKYESIIKAINVARMSGKTVRLTSQKCSDQNSGPQFGIYAIPNATEYYVFVGPYDKDEPLGIETVKSFSYLRQLKRTRGVWITTRKVDNIKVIDNPLSFMPPKHLQQSDIISLENESAIEHLTKNVHVSTETSTADVLDNAATKNPKIVEKKSIKPIKIRKTNGFYHLASKDHKFVKQVSLLKNTLHGDHLSTTSNVLKSPLKSMLAFEKNPVLTLPLPPLIRGREATLNSASSKRSVSTLSTYDASISCNSRPVAEIAPHIKITDVHSEALPVQENKIMTKKPECSMLVLKPEEINKRLMENKMTKPTGPVNDNNITSDPKLNQDIENFLATSVVCSPPNADTLIISDEDDSNQKLLNDWKDVWIECTNNEHLGWIRGKKNEDNHISFEFPGFMFTDFYDTAKAFSKINQVLSRKIYVPKNIKLEWRVVDCVNDLKAKRKLKSEDFGADLVLTKRGFRHRRDLMVNSSTLTTEASTAVASSSIATSNAVPEMDKAIDMMTHLEERCAILDEQSALLMNELRTKMLRSISHVPANQREQMSKTLHSFISDSTGES